MKIEFYWAVRGAKYTETVFAECIAMGHTIKVISSIDDERYRRRKSLVNQLWIRWLTYGWFPLKAIWHLSTHAPEADVVRITVTTPFYAPALIQLMSRSRKIPTVCLLLDLFPDALYVAGKLEPASAISRLLAAVTRYSIRESWLVIYLGERLKNYAEQTYGPARRLAVVPVGADGDFLKAAPAMIEAGRRIRLLYAGTMGRMHETETLLKFLEKDFPGNLEIVFNSSGAKYEGFKRQASARLGHWKDRVFFDGPLSDDHWKEAMNRAQVALVTMLPGAARVVMPSKSYSAIVAGQAVVAICPSESDLADMVLQHDCGWQVEPGDVEGLRHVMEEIAGNGEMLLAKRQRAFEAGNKLYDSKVVARRILHEAAQLRPSE